MSRFFFNAEGNYIGDISKFLDIASNSEPNWSVIINNLNTANQLRAVSPKTKIIFREKSNDFPSEDANIWLSTSPEKYAEKLMRYNNKLDWLYILNEPPTNNAIELSHWLVECAKKILEKGFAGVVLANFAVGNLQMEQIKNGEYDELIKFAGENTAKVRIGLHEGSGVLIPVGVGLINFDNILKLKYIENFPNVPKEWLYKYTERFYHILRYQWLQARALEINSPLPKYVITEFCIDTLSDIEENLIFPLQRIYGLPPLRGYKTYAPIWDDLLGLSVSRAYVKQLIWADNQYPEDVDGILIYCWWNNFKQWETFDVSDDLFLHEWLKHHKSPVNIGDVPVNNFPPLVEWESAVIAPIRTFSNVRDNSNVSSEIIFKIEGKVEVKMLPKQSKQEKDGLWTPIYYNQQYGYIRGDTYLTFENVELVYSKVDQLKVNLVNIIKQLIALLR